ncbi:hypothetical protein Clacol_007811 [Clathrus columnatus]|uniref:Uncharacterized protein n=1 Tax=Clathrus columnatus TaxID=1419009 RepID=A0AAV5AKT8_9AGAM|nr:hypothetical protein Clacol_007811 [Clathrus columnatus]
MRGFNNLQVGKLLLPPNLASEWDTDIVLQQRYQQGLEIPNSNALVRAFCMIFQGLSSVEGHGPSGRATKKGNAELNNMHKVTVPSIVYIATLVQFALDSAPTFASGGAHGTFNYHTFYTSIITLFMMLQMKDFQDSLLTWWNQQVFPYQDPEQINYNDTVHAQMLVQLLVNDTNN